MRVRIQPVTDGPHGNGVRQWELPTATFVEELPDGTWLIDVPDDDVPEHLRDAGIDPLTAKPQDLIEWQDHLDAKYKEHAGAYLGEHRKMAVARQAANRRA